MYLPPPLPIQSLAISPYFSGHHHPGLASSMPIAEKYNTSTLTHLFRQGWIPCVDCAKGLSRKVKAVIGRKRS